MRRVILLFTVIAAALVVCSGVALAAVKVGTNGQNLLMGAGPLSARLSITDLGTLGGTFSFATDINERRQVVGRSITGSGELHAFLWEKDTMIDLGTLGGTFSEAFAINQRGEIVGESDTASGEFHAFLWERGKMTDLGTLGGCCSTATAINNREQVVGSAPLDGGDETRAFLWERGTMIDLGTLGGFGQFLDSNGEDINNRGQIVGLSETGSRVRPTLHAFLWQEGTLRDLGTLPGGDQSEAFGINQRGQVVGGSSTASGEVHAVLWSK